MVPIVRSRAGIVLDQIWPSFAVGLVVQVTAFLLVAQGTWGAPGGPRIDVLSTFAAIIFFHTAMGYMLGRLLPTPISVPAALFLSYVWLGFTWSSGYFPLRYLAGLAISGCCRADTQLNPAALVSASVFSVGSGFALIFIAATVLRATRRSIVRGVGRFGIAAVLIVASTVVGLSVATGLWAYPAEARSRTQLVCNGTRPEVCLFPEQDAPPHTSRSVLTSAYRQLTAIGVKLPPRIEASPDASTSETLKVAVMPVGSTDQLVYSFATSILQPTLFKVCSSPETLRPQNAEVIINWLTSEAALGVRGASGRPLTPYAASGGGGVHQLQKLPVPQQVAWIETNLKALTDCSLQATTVPAR